MSGGQILHDMFLARLVIKWDFTVIDSQQSANIDCRNSIAAHRVFEIRPARAKDCDLDAIPSQPSLQASGGV